MSFHCVGSLQVLAYICCSRVGLAEAEIMELLSLQWCEWAPLVNALVFERSILIERNGLVVVSHEQVTFPQYFK